jgi:pimeloyl-ACP methyl ester carboxylesterase
MSTAVLLRKESWLNGRDYPFESRYLDVAGGRMHYIDEGQGEPILFLHGSPSWSYMWRHPVRTLSATHRCVAPDWLGFGLSDKPEEWDYWPSSHAKNLAALIDALGLEKFTMVAHDFGGPIGISYALEHPERVSRLVLTNTWMWGLHGEAGAERLGKIASGPMGKFLYMRLNLCSKMIGPLFANKENYTEEVHGAYCGPFRNVRDRSGPWKMAQHIVDSAAWYDDLWESRHVLADKPMLFLWGMRDLELGEKVLNKLWHEFPMAEVEQFESAGHFVFEEAARAATHRLEQFVAKPLEVDEEA